MLRKCTCQLAQINFVLQTFAFNKINSVASGKTQLKVRIVAELSFTLFARDTSFTFCYVCSSCKYLYLVKKFIAEIIIQYLIYVKLNRSFLTNWYPRYIKLLLYYCNYNYENVQSDKNINHRELKHLSNQHSIVVKSSVFATFLINIGKISIEQENSRNQWPSERRDK